MTSLAEVARPRRVWRRASATGQVPSFERSRETATSSAGRPDERLVRVLTTDATQSRSADDIMSLQH